MKRKALIISALLAILCFGLVEDADAHRRGYRRGYGNRFRPARVWIAPPPPVIVVGPRYRHRPPFARPYYRHKYYSQPYAYRRTPRRW
jgi:hypothetical protein